MRIPVLIQSFGVIGFLSWGCQRDVTSTPSACTKASAQSGSNASLALAGGGFADAAGQFLAVKNANVDLVEKANSYRYFSGPDPQGLHLANGVNTAMESTSFDFFVNNIAICHYNATVSRVGAEMFMIGAFPSAELAPIKGVNFPTLEEASAAISENVKKEGGKATSFAISRPCWIVRNKDLLPAVEAKFNVGTNEFHGIVFNESSNSESGVMLDSIFQDFFSTTTASATIYMLASTNVGETTYASTTVQLTNVSESTLLCNQDFSTTAATSETRSYVFAPGTQPFGETDLFYNANLHAEWLLSLGILDSWPAPQIVLLADPSPTSEASPAYHSSSTGEALISMYLTDNIKEPALKNLWYDPDVVAHEVNHHIVYQRLTQVKKGSEALTIHEALADYLVMARFNRSCFAPTVCVGTSICSFETCLRSAENQKTKNISKLSTQDQEAHRKGQVISGMLWDIQQAIPEPLFVAKLTLKAIFFLNANADFTGLLLALVKADNGVHTDILKTNFCSRGFASQIRLSQDLQNALGGGCS